MGASRALRNWMLTSEGQSVVKECRYVPLGSTVRHTEYERPGPATKPMATSSFHGTGRGPAVIDSRIESRVE